MSVATLADVKAYMNITTSTSDVELQKFIDAAEAAVVKRCGPLAATPVTKRVRGGKDVLTVSLTPVISLTSVTPVNSTALDVTKLNADPTGVIEYLAGGTFFMPFYDVVYSAGRASVPADLLEGVWEQARHQWESQIGGSRRPGTPTPPAAPVNSAALSPRTVELISPYMQGGIA
jgi:hypothetical protein